MPLPILKVNLAPIPLITNTDRVSKKISVSRKYDIQFRASASYPRNEIFMDDTFAFSKRWYIK